METFLEGSASQSNTYIFKGNVPLAPSSQGHWYCPLMQLKHSVLAHLASNIPHQPFFWGLPGQTGSGMGTDRETEPCQARKEGGRGQTSFFCHLTVIKSISLCKFSQPALIRWEQIGVHQGLGGSRSSCSSFLLLPALKNETLKIYFPCRKIWVKKTSFQKCFLIKSDFFFFSVKMPSLSLFSKLAC